MIPPATALLAPGSCSFRAQARVGSDARVRFGWRGFRRAQRHGPTAGVAARAHRPHRAARERGHCQAPAAQQGRRRASRRRRKAAPCVGGRTGAHHFVAAAGGRQPAVEGHLARDLVAVGRVRRQLLQQLLQLVVAVGRSGREAAAVARRSASSGLAGLSGQEARQSACASERPRVPAPRVRRRAAGARRVAFALWGPERNGGPQGAHRT